MYMAGDVHTLLRGATQLIRSLDGSKTLTSDRGGEIRKTCREMVDWVQIPIARLTLS